MQVAVEELQGINALIDKLALRGFPSKGLVWHCGDFSIHSNGMVINHNLNTVLGFIFHDGDEYIFDFGRHGDPY